MAECPSEGVLEAFVDGRLPPAQHAELLAHIDRCSACSEVTIELARVHDPRVSPPSDGAADPGSVGDPLFLGNARFTLRRSLGAGGFGTVFEAWDRERSAVVALKLLKEQRGDALYRFKQEFRALCTLTHPNLVTLYELLSEGLHWFFTMELVPGSDFLRHVREGTGGAAALARPVSPAEAFDDSSADHRPVVHAAPPLPRLCDALLQLTEGLHWLHAAGKLHRDIKPANILCTPEGRVVLLDFGLAQEIDVGAGSGHLVGTPAYMSPEQAAAGPLGPATDWYSVGVVLHEALTGQLPFVGAPLQVLRQKIAADAPSLARDLPGVPADLALLCEDLLRRDPARRPSGEAIRERLIAIQALGGRATPRPAMTARGDADGPGLVGRADHLATLAAAHASTAAGRPVLVFCHGGSGLGKSALCRHFLRGLGETVVLGGRCYQHEQVPFKALDGVVDALSRYLAQLPAEAAAMLLPRDIAALCRLFRVLEGVPVVQRAPARPIADPEVQRAAYGADRRLAAGLPLVGHALLPGRVPGGTDGGGVMSYPSSWYLVARSDEIRPGQVVGKRFFGRDLVLWRTSSGVFRVSDATCPHLGSDLARLGAVKGEHLVCTSHQFHFDGAGDCVGTMFGGPPRGCPKSVLRPWPVREIGPFCFVYHDELGRPPTWEMPREVLIKPDSVHLARNSYTFDTDVEFVNEDNFDIGHFYKYHDIFDVVPSPVTVDGHTIRVRYDFKRGSMISRRPLLGGLVPQLVGNFGSVLYGHGLTHFDMFLPQYRFHMEYLVFPTPISPGKVAYNAFLRRDPVDRQGSLLRRALLTVVNEFAFGMAYLQLRGEHALEGPQYWETKRRVASPVLADEEQDLIGPYRAWSQQFAPRSLPIHPSSSSWPAR